MTNSTSADSDALRVLIDLANAALEESISDAERVDRIDKYCEQFAVWEAQGMPRLSSDEQMVESLQHQHTQVLDQARLMAAETRSDLHALRKRAKGLMRYVDQLPRQISAWIQRKG
jgi:hypothetical protein